MFEASLVNDTARTARPYTVSLSLILQVAAAAGAVMYPLWHIEALPFLKLRVPSPFRNATPLVDPKPAQQMVARPVSPSPRIFIPLPRHIEARAETSPQIEAPQFDAGPAGPSGPVIPGFYTGGGNGPAVIESVAPPHQVVKPAPVTAAAVVPSGPVRPGGRVKPPELIHEVKPSYPQLAVTTRTQGTVKIEAIISRDGFVRDARVVSGHPLLVAAALDAVRQWRYRPTILNDQPVEVALALEVHFTLSR